MLENNIPDPGLEHIGDACMACAMYKSAEAFYRQALKAIGKKTWTNRKDWKRVWNKMMTAMHLESERRGK